MVSVVPPGGATTIHWNRRAPLLHIYLNDQFLDSMLENVQLDLHEVGALFLMPYPFLVEMGKTRYRKLQFGSINELFAKFVATEQTPEAPAGTLFR
jgi:hypothetical protein